MPTQMDEMSEDLAAAQKEEEDRKANHSGLVAAKEEIATLTATIETKLTRPGDLRASEIVELVAGEVVCNARTGIRRQHGWTCTYRADRGCSGTTDLGDSAGAVSVNALFYFGTPALDRCFWRVGEGWGGLWFACKSTGFSTGGRAHNPPPLSL